MNIPYPSLSPPDEGEPNEECFYCGKSCGPDDVEVDDNFKTICFKCVEAKEDADHE
jgi:hypothetical protein